MTESKRTRWTDEELDNLLDVFDGGATIEEVLAISKRTANAVISKLAENKRVVMVRGGYARRDPFHWVSFDWLERHKNLHEDPTSES